MDLSREKGGDAEGARGVATAASGEGARRRAQEDRERGGDAAAGGGWWTVLIYTSSMDGSCKEWEVRVADAGVADAGAGGEEGQERKGAEAKGVARCETWVSVWLSEASCCFPT